MGIVVGEVRQHLLGKSEFIPLRHKKFLELLINVLLCLKSIWAAACGGADTQVTAYLDFRNGTTLVH